MDRVLRLAGHKGYDLEWYSTTISTANLQLTRGQI